MQIHGLSITNTDKNTTSLYTENYMHLLYITNAYDLILEVASLC